MGCQTSIRPPGCQTSIRPPARSSREARGCRTSIRPPEARVAGHPSARQLEAEPGLPDIHPPASSKQQGSQMREATNMEKGCQTSIRPPGCQTSIRRPARSSREARCGKPPTWKSEASEKCVARLAIGQVAPQGRCSQFSARAAHAQNAAKRESRQRHLLLLAALFNREALEQHCRAASVQPSARLGVPATDVIETPAMEPPWLGIRRLAQRNATCAAALP